MRRTTALMIIVIAAFTQFGCRSTIEQGPLVDQSIEAKIDKIIAKMTLEEKAGQMSQLSKYGEAASGSIEDNIRDGRAGSFLNIDDINLRNRFQRIAIEESRLGIPLIFGFDVIHGYRTIFPVPLAEAASWDIDLLEKTAAVAAKEARASGIDWTFSPMVDIARDPRWGRIVEGAGEDTYLGSLISRAKVKGYQGDDLSDPDAIAACLKHFAVYGASQAGREYHTTEVPLRTIRDVYLPPFEAGIEAGAATVMSGFNDLNGVPASASKFLLTDVLRDEWGFDGFVVSDYKSVTQIISHGVAENEKDAAIMSSVAGVDMEMVSRTYYDYLPSLVRQGAVSVDILDTAVRRILRVKFQLGLFDHPYADPELQESVTLTPSNRSLARQAVRQSMVLLKNENNLLPLKENLTSIALIGPLADNQSDLLGTWSLAGKAEDVITVLQGLSSETEDKYKVNYAKGCEIDGDSTDGFADAIKVATQSDIVIMALGEGTKHNGEAHSRTSLDLPGVQLDLLKEIHKTGKPIVLLLFAGRPLTINWELENISAILLAWHPGVEGGNGIADVLLGKYNPSGKLTVTWPRRVGQIPIYYNMKNTGRPFAKDDPYTSGYIDSPNSPLLPFGFGLSYTTFAYTNLRVETPQVRIPGIVKVSADITNTGSVAGFETVQLYVRDLVGSVTRPVKELKGFQRIYLHPGQTKTASFEILTDDLRFCDINMNYAVEPGQFTVWIGPNSAEGLESEFALIN